MKEYIQIVTTADSGELARQIAQSLVEKKIAACAQVSGPITSVYHWKNKIETSAEYYCVIKTRRDMYSKVEAAIKEMHSYTVPEIIALPILEGSGDYLAWIDEVVQ